MDKHHLLEGFSNALYTGFGTIFVGSGISVASKVPNWAKLLQPRATRLGLSLTDTDDLPLVAQYIVNANGGNRGPLIHEITSQLSKYYPLNKYHQALSQTNVSTLWTTNFDTLLEQAFDKFAVDVKANDSAISRTVPGYQVEIIKIHGCIATSPYDDLVVTEEDYEDFSIKRPATTEKLKIELLNKSFLFIGYSYGDPNIRNIVVEARRLSQKATRQHYIVLKKEQEADRKRRQSLWCDNLKRTGIACVFIEKDSELEEILFSIAQKSRGPTIYVTGSHEKSSPLTRDLGKDLAHIDNIILLDGQQSSGIGREITTAFTEECALRKVDIQKRLRIFPNPYAANPQFSNDPLLLPTLKQWRAPLLRSAQLVLVFDGGMGTQAEVEVARDLGCRIIPVPETRDGLAYNLLQDNEVSEFLTQQDPQYLTVASNCSVTVKKVVSCVHKALTA